MGLSIPNLRHLSDSSRAGSLADRLRVKRFARFERFIQDLPRPLSILDIGGTTAFWVLRNYADLAGVSITTLNLDLEPQSYRNIHPVLGDATDLAPFADRSFDVVFSNSVIEHLFTLENQRRMAAEVQRVGKRYWVQTPNYWFPMEPHFQVPGWQWMPLGMRAALLRRWRCGWRGPCADPESARTSVREVRLLTRRELAHMLPGATLLPERFAGFVKSWTAYGASAA